MKFPIFDEAIRGVCSIGDLVTGNPDRAAGRWKNWTEDSFIAGAGKTVGLTVASGACAVVGQTGTAGNLIRGAGAALEQTGATTTAAVYDAAGVAAQVVTLGIPNPLSGACQGVASGFAAEIDKTAASRDGFHGHMDWGHAIDEAGIKMLSGGASSGGLIPYAGTATECALRGEEIKFDHGKEWASAGLNAATTVVTAGTASGMSSAINAGRVGAKTAITTAATVGGATGGLNALGQSALNRDATIRKLVADGYTFQRTRQNASGAWEDVYSKGQHEVAVPRVDAGDVVGSSIMGAGMAGAATALHAYSEAAQDMRQAVKTARQPRANKPDTTPAAPYRTQEAWRDTAAFKRMQAEGKAPQMESASGARSSAPASSSSRPAASEAPTSMSSTARTFTDAAKSAPGDGRTNLERDFGEYHTGPEGKNPLRHKPRVTPKESLPPRAQTDPGQRHVEVDVRYPHSNTPPMKAATKHGFPTYQKVATKSGKYIQGIGEGQNDWTLKATNAIPDVPDHQFYKNVNGSSTDRYTIPPHQFHAATQSLHPLGFTSGAGCARINCPGTFDVLGHMRCLDAGGRCVGPWEVAPICYACNNSNNVHPMYLDANRVVPLREVRRWIDLAPTN